MSGSLVDANILLDIATADATWMPWSQDQIRAAAERGAIYINPIIYAELAPAFTTVDALDRWLDPTLFRRAALPFETGWLAAQAFLKYRKSGGVRTAPPARFLYRCACADREPHAHHTRRG